MKDINSMKKTELVEYAENLELDVENLKVDEIKKLITNHFEDIGVIKIEILNKVTLKEDLTIYSDDRKKNMKVYAKGQIIENVDAGYLDRFSKYPKHIKIING